MATACNPLQGSSSRAARNGIYPHVPAQVRVVEAKDLYRSTSPLRWLPRGSRNWQAIERLPEALAIAIMSIGANAETSPQELLTTNSAFVRYLQDPPFIKEMRFVESTYHEAGPVPGHITVRGWVNMTNRLAIQPSGMFFETLNPNPVPFAAPASSRQRVVEGVSDRNIWQANVDSQLISFSPLRSEEGGSESNRLQRLMDVRLRWHINPVRYFGFPPLRTHSFRLTGPAKFEATTAEGNSLTGEVLSVDEDRPTRLEYTTGANMELHCLLTYKYDPRGKLPKYFEREQLLNKRQYGLSLTNWIEEVDYGIAGDIRNGFYPQMFFTNLAVFTRTLIESNGQRYEVIQNGILKPVNEQYDLAFGTRWSKPGRSIMFVLIALLVCNGIFCLYVWRVRGRGGGTQP